MTVQYCLHDVYVCTYTCVDIYMSLNLQEFFMLLLRDVMDPKYGMFLYYEESRLQWFNAQV